MNLQSVLLYLDATVNVLYAWLAVFIRRPFCRCECVHPSVCPCGEIARYLSVCFCVDVSVDLSMGLSI